MLLLKIVQLDRIGCMKCDIQDLPERQDVSEIPLVEDIIQYHQKAIDILKRPGKIADKKTQVKDVVDIRERVKTQQNHPCNTFSNDRCTRFVYDCTVYIREFISNTLSFD